MRIEPVTAFDECAEGQVAARPALRVAWEAGFDFRAAEYERLFESSDATAFQHPLWLHRLYRNVAPPIRAEPLVVTLRDGATGRLAAVLPLVRRNRGLLRMVEFADFGLTDYAGPVCGRDEWKRLVREPTLSRAMLRALRPFDLLRIAKLREDGPDLRPLFGSASHSVMPAAAHEVALHGAFPEWRADRMTASLRKELDQKRKRLGRKGEILFACLRDPASIELALTSLREFRRSRFESRAETDVLADGAMFDFYRGVAVDGAASGFARTYTLAFDGRPVAVVFGIAHAGRFMVLLSAFDNTFRKSSLGYLLFEDIVADCIARGDAVFDLTIGNEGYKQDLGARPTRLFEIRASGSAIGLAADLCLRQEWVKKLVKRSLAGPAPGLPPS
jgi:CelD/BcsL family acetyltransferase involved in cellulose biosynthesis